MALLTWDYCSLIIQASHSGHVCYELCYTCDIHARQYAMLIRIYDLLLLICLMIMLHPHAYVIMHYSCIMLFLIWLNILHSSLTGLK